MDLKPDYGMRLTKDGYDSPHVEHIFYDVPIYGFDTLGIPGQYTLALEKMYAGEAHSLSLDFGPASLGTILTALPMSERQEIEAELNREPYMPKKFDFSHPIRCDSVIATLGALQHGIKEAFIPLNVREMNISPKA